MHNSDVITKKVTVNIKYVLQIKYTTETTSYVLLISSQTFQ